MTRTKKQYPANVGFKAGLWQMAESSIERHTLLSKLISVELGNQFRI
ncbi:MAG: hypothetical protein M3X11_17235 [Acidobacteriota bacterium]|nr:hypothetical protein [Acidobacteriota bacterium]